VVGTIRRERVRMWDTRAPTKPVDGKTFRTPNSQTPLFPARRTTTQLPNPHSLPSSCGPLLACLHSSGNRRQQALAPPQRAAAAASSQPAGPLHPSPTHPTSGSRQQVSVRGPLTLLARCLPTQAHTRAPALHAPTSFPLQNATTCLPPQRLAHRTRTHRLPGPQQQQQQQREGVSTRPPAQQRPPLHPRLHLRRRHGHRGQGG